MNARTGAINDVNPFLIRMLGYSREEFTKKKLWEVGAFKDIKASKEAFRVLQKNDYIRYKDLPLKTKDGILIQVEFVSNVYQAGDEKVIQCNIRDISERKLAQDALQKSREHLREQSIRDHLTGLFNRRYMEETLERELHRASRKKYPLDIIMLDVDHFRLVNNTYGHAAGDAVLRELGNLLSSQVRREDISSRIGGDEFIILLPDAAKKVTRKRAELLCGHARSLKIDRDGQTLEGITLSGGVAVFPEDGSTGSEILKAADEALYRSKHDGRDRIVVTNE